MDCDFCNKKYASKYSFRTHLKTNKHIEKKQKAYDKLNILADEVKAEVEQSEHLSNLMCKFLVAEKIFDRYIEYDNI